MSELQKRFRDNKMMAQEYVANRDPNTLAAMRNSNLSGQKNNRGTPRRIMAHGGVDRTERDRASKFAEGARLTSHEPFERLRSSTFVPLSVDVLNIGPDINPLMSDSFYPLFGKEVLQPDE